MIRIIVFEADGGMAANVGGPVLTTHRTFDVEIPELESFLSEPRKSKTMLYTNRGVVGVEVIEATP